MNNFRPFRAVRGGGLLSRILSLHTDSGADSLRVARQRVREAVLSAGASVGTASEIELAVGEALSNTHTHAYPGAAGPVEIQVDWTGSHVTAVVIDQGQATVPPVIPETLPAASLIGGRGLYLMRFLVENVAIAVGPAGHGLVLRMIRRV